MCGICGIISFDAQPVCEQRLQDCCRDMRHRGPNDEGIWTHVSARVAAGLGAVRLAIQDPSLLGHQPMIDPTGRYVLVFNGEIYNFRDLRRELEGDPSQRWTSRSDTEVVLAACVKWGVDALDRFNGMWALAFYDREAGDGFLSRDRFGIKPLCYAGKEQTLLFASETRSLGPLGLDRRDIDPKALTQHLQYGFIPHPRTIYKDVCQLEPGHLLRFNSDGIGRTERYFDPLAVGTVDQEDHGDYRTMLRRAIGEAVACRRVSDVPIGAFLSGGIDSSIVVAHLSETMGRAIKTFSVGYAGQDRYDETAYARLVADRFGTEHHEVVLTERDALEAVPWVLDHLGEPFGDASIIPTSLVSEFAARFVTVILSGDGADELFGGYWRYSAHSAYEAFHRIPGPIRRYLVEPMIGALGSSKSSMLGNRVRQLRKLLRTNSVDPLARHIAWSRILSPEAAGLFRQAGHSDAADDAAITQARELTERLPATTDPLNRILAYDLVHQLPADMLRKVDLASMMHSLEVRVPFLDPAVVRAALSLPASSKVHRGLRKRALVQAYRGRLPDQVLDRGKQGFELPIGEFLRGQLRDMFHDVVDRTTVESFGLLSYDAVQGICREHQERRSEHADVLFSLLSLCWWQGYNCASKSVLPA